MRPIPELLKPPRFFEKTWFSLGPADIMTDTLISFWMKLEEFMTAKLLYEGKAWSYRHEIWLAHEGENIDQAKARVDD
ncbi:hypothetical protein PITC_002680 [Penicillium italicum]|uniref:Uncharacterized protein n=1 Tax=Penicillium italicum TaxID=40296 RepID=A0A0A2L617_PENIT|nr:hypothetical protein PITC_002680 [Penicillium italicum]